MRFKAGRKTGFTLGNPVVWNAGWKSIMQVKFHPLGTVGLGYYFVSKNSQQETRRAGLNGSSNNREVGDFVGWENEATPLEGAKRRYPAHFSAREIECTTFTSCNQRWTASFTRVAPVTSGTDCVNTTKAKFQQPSTASR